MLNGESAEKRGRSLDEEWLEDEIASRHTRPLDKLQRSKIKEGKFGQVQDSSYFPPLRSLSIALYSARL